MKQIASNSTEMKSNSLEQIYECDESTHTVTGYEGFKSVACVLFTTICKTAMDLTQYYTLNTKGLFQ
jgi:hypothetical protein